MSTLYAGACWFPAGGGKRTVRGRRKFHFQDRDRRVRKLPRSFALLSYHSKEDGGGGSKESVRKGSGRGGDSKGGGGAGRRKEETKEMP
eukprot:160340-Hanusia_phi.AAC.1